MLIPAPRLIAVCAAWALAGLAAAVWADIRGVWALAGATAAALAAYDARAAQRDAARLSVERDAVPVLPVGRPHRCVIRLQSTLSQTLRLSLTDDVPGAFASEGVPASLTVPPASGALVAYRVTPLIRGSFAFGAITTRTVSRWRLWVWQRSHAAAATVRVFPDFVRARQAALDMESGRLAALGIVRAPRRGAGLEFRELRDYREGDSPRHVDWKATARRQRVVVRAYQDERDQRLLVLLDCGRRMRAHDGALSHFDEALTGVLLLASLALRQDDAVGVDAFGLDEPRRIPPRKSLAQLQHLTTGLFDLQPTLHEPDYLEVARRVATTQRRRACVVLVTNVRGEDAEELDAAVGVLRRRHHVSVASLRDAVLDRWSAMTVDTTEDARHRAAALQFADERRRALARLSLGGAGVLDVAPMRLASALASHYWTLKRSGRL